MHASHRLRHAILLSSLFALASAATALPQSSNDPIFIKSIPGLISLPPDHTASESGAIFLAPYSLTGQPLSFQWFFGETPIPGATNANLLLGPATTNMTGQYRLQVRTDLGEGSATTRVHIDPADVTFFANSTIPEEGSALVISLIPEVPSASIQWFKNGQPLLNETNRNLFIASPTRADSGAYHPEVVTASRKRSGTPLSIEVQPRITAGSPPVFSGQGATVGLQGGFAELGINPIYIGGTAPFRYQWRRDNLELPGETNYSLLFTNLRPSDAGAYILTIRNDHGQATFTNTLSVEIATELDRWHWRKPSPQGSRLYTAAFGDGRFVAVGRAGNIITSTNGIDWLAARLDPTLDVFDLTFENGHFHAFAFSRSSGLLPNLISTDGLNWTYQPGATSGIIPSVRIPGRTNETFRLGYPTLVYSTNQLDWTPVPQAPANTSFIAAGNGRIVLLGSTFAFSSPDGFSWTPATNTYSLGFSEMAFGAGKFIALPYFLPTIAPTIEKPQIFVSADGSSWERVTTPRLINEIIYAGDSAAIATLDDLPGLLLVTTNGTTWEEVDTGGRQEISSVTFGNGRYVAVGAGGTIATSTDARNWSGIDPLISIDLFGVTQGANNLTVAAGEDGTILTSTNGIDWTPAQSATSEFLRSVHFANKTYLALGNDGTIVVSTNGTTWAQRSTPTEIDLRRAAFGNGLWVAVGEHNIILTSPDTITWTERTLDSITFATEHEGVAYGNGTWVVVGGYFATRAIPTVFYSTNGVDWLPARNFSTGKRLRDVTFANGLFVAVGNDSAIVVSSNGIEWQPVLNAFGNLRRVIFARGRFIAVGNDGRLISAENPRSLWTTHPTPSSQNMHDIALRPDGTYLAIGNNGMILQSDPAYPRFDQILFNQGIIQLLHSSSFPSTILEESPDLRTWTTIPTTTQTPPSGPARFFRLRASTPPR